MLDCARARRKKKGKKKKMQHKGKRYHPGSRAGQGKGSQRQKCQLCGLAGIKGRGTSWSSEETAAAHEQMHKEGEISTKCTSCELEYVVRDSDTVLLHACGDCIREHQPGQRGGRRQRPRVAENAARSPGGSSSSSSEDVDGNDGPRPDPQAADGEEQNNNNNNNNNAGNHDGDPLANFGPPPLWADGPFTADSAINMDVSNHLGCDQMLLSMFLKANIGISKEQMGFLYKVLNSQEFRQNYENGQISRSFDEVWAKEKESFAADRVWRKEILGDGGQTVAYVRDLKSVMVQLLSDRPLMSVMEFTGETARHEDHGYQWGRHWTAFPIYQSRLRQAREALADADVKLFSFLLWYDGGDTGGSNKMDVFVLVPLNVPYWLSRRLDSYYPIAYVENKTPSTNLIDVLDFFMPQLFALRDRPRQCFNVLFDPNEPQVGSNVESFSAIFSIDSVCGDHPALTKMLGLCGSVSSLYPCSLCLLRNCPNEGQNANDTTRWTADLRSQEQTRRDILRMREVDGFDQRHCGIRNEFRHRANPLLEYFRTFLGLVSEFGLFDFCWIDLLHDRDLGLFRFCFKIMAQEVIDNGAVAQRQFLEACETVFNMHLRGVDVTLHRPHLADKSKNNVLGLLASGALYAREYVTLAPLLLVIFDYVDVDVVRQAIRPLCDLVSFGFALECQDWPLNQPQNWYDDLSRFAVQAFRDFCGIFRARIPANHKHIKQHRLLAHSMRVFQLHGQTMGVHGLEAIFLYLKSMTTNWKNAGIQQFRKFHVFLKLQSSINAGSSLPMQVVGDIMLRTSVAQHLSLFGPELPDNCFSLETQALKRASPFLRPKFVKWARVQFPNPYAAEQGPKKIYAAPNWHNRSRFDIVELKESSYFMVVALFRGYVLHKDGVTEKDCAVAIGYDMVVHSPNGLGDFHLRMPVIRKPQNAALKVERLDRDEARPVVAIQYFCRADIGEPSLLNMLGPSYQPGDLVFHHNIFISRGEMRYGNEFAWFPIVNLPADEDE